MVRYGHKGTLVGVQIGIVALENNLACLLKSKMCSHYEISILLLGI